MVPVRPATTATATNTAVDPVTDSRHCVYADDTVCNQDDDKGAASSTIIISAQVISMAFIIIIIIIIIVSWCSWEHGFHE
jgi:hypothetical protein